MRVDAVGGVDEAKPEALLLLILFRRGGETQSGNGSLLGPEREMEASTSTVVELIISFRWVQEDKEI